MLRLLLVALVLSGCTTCPHKQTLFDGISSVAAKRLHCSNTLLVKSDVADLFSGQDLCSKDTITIREAPKVSLTEGHLSCMRIAWSMETLPEQAKMAIINNEIKFIPNWRRWGCKSADLDITGFENLCMALASSR